MTPSLPFGFVIDDDPRQNMAAVDEAAAAETVRSSEAWKRNATLQHHSRAFDRFLHLDDGDRNRDDVFFVPSYLEKSTYVQKLKEAHDLKVLARQEVKPATSGDFPSSLVDFPSNSLPSGSHRGLSHSVIERQPSPAEDDALPPLPTAWNKEDSGGGLEIMPDGRTAKFTGPRNHHEREQEACAVRADHYMPPQCGIYYYEVQIISSKKDDTTIAIGFSTKGPSLSRPIGWEPESWGYHGDDGRSFNAQNVGHTFGAPFNAGDIIGCGVNFREHKAFFTRNGAWIGNAFQDLSRGKLYPSISLKKPGEVIKTNFGQEPFVYNIGDAMEEQRSQIGGEIQEMDTSRLEPGLNETDLIQALVLQFLQHDGYVDTARAFAEEMKDQKQALALDPHAKVDGVNVRDDEDAYHRQRIRSAILEGDIDKALKLTQAFYPTVLSNNQQVHFRLKCRKFVEMVRKAAQLRMAMENTSNHRNGLGGEGSSQKMDIDQAIGDSSTWDVNMDSEASASAHELEELEGDIIGYGQSLQAEYASDPRKEVGKALGEIWVLIAYTNPLKEPKVSHLLDRKGRVSVAEELNSAILSSLGKSSRAALETVYAQTSVLLEELRQEGGAGAFISMQDVVEGIPSAYQS